MELDTPELLVSVTFEEIMAQQEREKNYIANVIASNELQLKWMAEHPSYDADTFAETFDVQDWIREAIENTPPESLEVTSPEYVLFCQALTVTAVTTRLRIPPAFVIFDHYVAAACRALVTTHQAVEQAKSELATIKATEQGDGYAAMTSPEITAAESAQIFTECYAKALADINNPPESVTEV